MLKEYFIDSVRDYSGPKNCFTPGKIYERRGKGCCLAEGSPYFNSQRSSMQQIIKQKKIYDRTNSTTCKNKIYQP